MITNTGSVIEEWIAMSKLTLFGHRTWPEAIYSTWEEMSFARYNNNRDFTMTANSSTATAQEAQYWH